MGYVKRESDLAGLTKDDDTEMITALGGESVQRELSPIVRRLEDKAFGNAKYGDEDMLVSGYKEV